MPSRKSLIIMFSLLWALTSFVSLRGGTIWYEALGIGAAVAAGSAAIFIGSMAVAVYLIGQAVKNK